MECSISPPSFQSFNLHFSNIGMLGHDLILEIRTALAGHSEVACSEQAVQNGSIYHFKVTAGFDRLLPSGFKLTPSHARPTSVGSLQRSRPRPSSSSSSKYQTSTCACSLASVQFDRHDAIKGLEALGLPLFGAVPPCCTSLKRG